MRIFIACFTAGMVALAVAMTILFSRKRKTSYRLSLATGSIWLTNMLMLWPIVLFEEPNPLVSAMSALQLAISNTASLNIIGKISVISSQYSESAFFTVYKIALTGTLLLAPLLVGSVILSFFKLVKYRLRLVLLAPIRDVYCFSELNASSLCLALNLERGPGLLVFCNCYGDSYLTEKAAEAGALLLAEPMEAVKLKGKRKRFFFCVSEDETQNLVGVQQLIQRFKACSEATKQRMAMYLFASKRESEAMLNATDKCGFSVTAFNERTAIAYDLLFTKPLFEAPQPPDSRELSVLIVGAGALGREILKAVAWCGQGGRPLRIHVVDCNAKRLEHVFQMECPELRQPNYDIHFWQADVQTSDFEALLTERCKQVGYIAVSLNDDDLNIETALFLRGHYLRQNGWEPVICAKVSDRTRQSVLEELTAVHREKLERKNWSYDNPAAQPYRIHPFGVREELYRHAFLMDNALEHMAKNVNAIYDHILNPETTAAQALYNYNANEKNKRSCRANAVHIAYKLWQLGFQMRLAQPGEEQNPEALKSLQALLADEAGLLEQAQKEHLRWNAFMRSEGYRGVSLEEARIFAAEQTGGSHTHTRAWLHACICDWDALIAVAEEFDQKIPQYDSELIAAIPEILSIVPHAKCSPGTSRYLLEPLG